MSNKINHKEASAITDSFVGKPDNLDKISEISTGDIKVDEFVLEKKQKEKIEIKTKKKVTFYPYITVKDIESYKEYNKEIYKQNMSKNNVSDSKCTCLII